ncbi:OLC1v1018658C1 [Oldenlandia corymbosa var. corymbosa]|uniref:OLC1v1018658C1 n=1 Tax=Oldenlandia corymbosa var. corymbosa TaxID=529605 RepID=A0AAV1EC82_OLDCO|nr:OLC1v1018658C1 [Oldenlandia corymbosa var. corymbosa]
MYIQRRKKKRQDVPDSSLLLGSGTRNMHGRVISASYRRGSPTGHKSKSESYMGQAGDSPPHSPSHSPPARRSNVICLRVRGLGAASASALPSTAINAQPWVVTRPIVGGSNESFFIPSFLTHVAHRLTDKSYKPSLEIDTRVTYFKLLKEWKDSMSTEAQILLAVEWLPYGPDPISDDPRTIYSGWIQYRDIIEPYLPSRVLRQIGYIQVISPPIPHPLSRNRSGNHHAYKVSWRATEAFDAWMQFPFKYRAGSRVF